MRQFPAGVSFDPVEIQYSQQHRGQQILIFQVVLTLFSINKVRNCISKTSSDSHSSEFSTQISENALRVSELPEISSCG